MTDTHPHPDDESRTIQVRIRRRQLRRVDAGARATGLTRSEAVRLALLEWTDKTEVIEERRQRLAEGA